MARAKRAGSARRICVAAALTTVGLLAARDFLRTPEATPIVRAIDRLLGYDGCMCVECEARYSFVSVRGVRGVLGGRYGGGCRPPRDAWDVTATWAAAAAVWFGGALALSAAAKRAARRRDIFACQSCGYDMRGLVRVDAVCPECGSATPFGAPPMAHVACQSCGYDLRGLAAGSACPECGGRHAD